MLTYIVGIGSSTAVQVCEATGGDVTLLSRALSYDTRIGGRFTRRHVGSAGAV